MMQSISLCDYVTERGASSKLIACAHLLPFLSVGTMCRPLNSSNAAPPSVTPQSKPRFYLFAMGKSGGTSCPLPSGCPKVNQDFISLLLGERRHESSAGSPKIFDLLGCFSTMTRSHRSIRPHCRTRRYRTRLHHSLRHFYPLVAYCLYCCPPCQLSCFYIFLQIVYV